MGNKKLNLVENQHSGKSFQKTVAEAVNQKLLDFLNSRFQHIAGLLTKRQDESLEDIYARLKTLEEIVCEKLNVPENEFASRVANIQDQSEGLVETEVVEGGNTVRIDLSTKTKDQKEFQGSTKTRVDNIGSAATFGPEIEGNILGMKKGETKEFEFGQNKEFIAKVVVHKISKRKDEPPTEVRTGLAVTEESV